MPRSFLPATLLLLAASLLLGGCDALTARQEGGPAPKASSIHFQGARHTTSDGARVASTPAGLTIRSASDPSPRAAVRIDPEGRARSVDLLFHTTDLRRGDAFSAAVTDEDGRALARVVHEGTGGGTNRVWADLSGYAPEAVTIRFYDGEKLLRQRRVRLDASNTDSLALATTDDEPDSWHEKTITNENGNEETVLVADYEDQSILPPLGGDSLATASAGLAAAGPTVGRANLRPVGKGAATTRQSGNRLPMKKQSPLRCSHIALVLEGARPGAQAEGIRLARRGAGSFTITDERFE